MGLQRVAAKVAKEDNRGLQITHLIRVLGNHKRLLFQRLPLYLTGSFRATGLIIKTEIGDLVYCGDVGKNTLGVYPNGAGLYTHISIARTRVSYKNVLE